MKIIFWASAILIAFTFILSCRNSHTNHKLVSGQGIEADSSVDKAHTSANSADWEGTYKGILPCADCEGVETEIILNPDNTFVKRTKYIGKDSKYFEISGAFSWNDTGNTITLAGITNAPSQYFVGENSLTQLDMQGEKITGTLAARYVLIK